MIGNDKIKVLIVDEYRTIRQGLAALLQTTPDIVVAGEAVDCETAVHKALELQPDVILMELLKPGPDGIEVIDRLIQTIPEARILVLSSFGEEQRVFSAFRSGARGYWLKDAIMTNVSQAIRDVYNGRLTLHPNLTEDFIHSLSVPHEIKQ